jgi:tetratricopeptide (TPR) repeat protein
MYLPNYLEQELKNYRMTSDSFHKTHKMVHFCILLMKNYCLILYFKLKCENEGKLKNIKKYICENFSRPTEGIWYQLFVQLIEIATDGKIFKKLLTYNNNDTLNKLYLALVSKDAKTSPNSICTFFQKVIKIKNISISHGLMTENNAEYFIKNIESILDEIIENTSSLFSYQLFLVSANETDTYTVDCYENEKFDAKQYSLESLASEGLYISIGKILCPTWPFLACRDGNILFYNCFERENHKVLFTKGSQEQYIHTEIDSLPELFGIDYNYLSRKPLNIQVICENGVMTNLPNAEYEKFIGRQKEISELKKALEHPRHFITALDGIGGVGKTAIALYTCYYLINNNQNKPFEYIIWLSAKNTLLKDGKIVQLEQSFEHLGQLLDTILVVLGFNEYIESDNLKQKSEIVYSLLEETKVLIVLDNLETIKPDNFEAIWNFIDNLPFPSKVLLTSREFPQSIPQTIRIENLSEGDSYLLIDQFSKEIGIQDDYLSGIRTIVYKLSSGLPVVIKSILGQIILGKHINTIKKEIETNTDNISKFCFEQQLRLLDYDQKIVILAISLSADVLNHDALQLVVSDLVSSNLVDIVQNLNTFSIIKINNTLEQVEYSILPIIKNYILNLFGHSELSDEVNKKLSSYYELKEVDNYNLLPIEASCISCESLIPKKMVDKAMVYAQSGEFEQAKTLFNKVTTEYSHEPYTWYMYSQFLAQYLSSYDRAIETLKKATELASNYIFYKKIGDYHLRLKNFQASVNNYQNAMRVAEDEKNKIEMLYLISNADFSHVKQIRRRPKDCFNNLNNIQERNNLYEEIIKNLENYLSTKPNSYDGKKIKIYRMLSESYFGLKQYDKAIDNINNAITLSDNDPYHTDYKNFILKIMTYRGVS